jgi:hypothetical protein
MPRNGTRGLVCALTLMGVTTAAQASISYATSGGSISENFDSLTTNTAAATAWANNSTLPGWSLFRQPAPGTAVATYLGGTGSSNTGTFFSFGGAGNSDRALGGVGSGGSYFGSPAAGTIAGWISVAITNDTASTLSEFTVGFDGEQWRNGGNTSAQTMVLEYGFGATFGAVASWTAPGGAFDFVSPTVGSTGAALDGNAAANRVAGLGGTISNLTWSAGDTLWVRWVERNDSGNDHGLSIDNFEFSAVPAPGSIALLGLGGLVAARRRR